LVEKKSFKELAGIDVSAWVEHKQNLSYLSWSKALSIAKDLDPEFEWFPNKFLKEITGISNEVPYFKDETGCFVEVTTILFGKRETETLAVMDFRNKAVLQPSQTDIQNTIKRCFVKSLALHGIGISLYSKDFAVENLDSEKLPREKIAKLNLLVDIIAVKTEKQKRSVIKRVLELAEIEKKEFSELNYDEYSGVYKVLTDIAKKFQ